MTRWTIFLFLTALVSAVVNGQSEKDYAHTRKYEKRSHSPIIGITAFNYVCPIIGYGMLNNYHGALNYDILHATELTSEFQFGKTFLTAPKITERIHLKTNTLFLVSVGCSYQYYTNFNKANHLVRPEIGLNFYYVLDILYGYNFTINNVTNFNYNKHCISLVIKPKYW